MPDEIELSEVSELFEEQESTPPPQPPSPPPSILDAKLEGDAVPENVRGQSVAELVRRTLAMEEALRRSEAARQDLARAVERPQPQPREEEQQKELTQEQLTELFQQDPVRAVSYMLERGLVRGLQHVEQRLAPLTAGLVTAGERYAREKYKEEFELFGDQIEAFQRMLPNPNALSSPQAWDDLISYIRGRPENLSKLIELEVKKRSPAPNGPDVARAAQRAAAGFTAAPVIRGETKEPERVGNVVFDEVTEEIRKHLGLTREEYAKWASIGG